MENRPLNLTPTMENFEGGRLLEYPSKESANEKLRSSLEGMTKESLIFQEFIKKTNSPEELQKMINESVAGM